MPPRPLRRRGPLDPLSATTAAPRGPGCSVAAAGVGSTRTRSSKCRSLPDTRNRAVGRVGPVVRHLHAASMPRVYDGRGVLDRTARQPAEGADAERPVPAPAGGLTTIAPHLSRRGWNLSRRGWSSTTRPRRGRRLRCVERPRRQFTRRSGTSPGAHRGPTASRARVAPAHECDRRGSPRRTGRRVARRNNGSGAPSRGGR